MSQFMIESLESRKLCAAVHPTFVEAATFVQELAFSGADISDAGSEKATVIQAHPAGERGSPLAIVVFNGAKNTLVIPGPPAAP